jgi:hippurate hydrolase
MLEDGLIDRHPKPDGAFALHITPNVPSGLFTSREGAFMASADVVRIKVTGKGGHASMPHMALDPMPIACEIVMALQAFVTRRINAFDPVILTIARIAGGTTNNVIPESVDLEGTLRSVSEESRKAAKAGIARVAEKIAEAHGATAHVDLAEGYPVTVNDGRMVRLAKDVTTSLYGERGYIASPAPVMGAEDWSYVLQRIPGCMVFLGVAPEGCNHHHAAPCHSNRMMLDEAAMANGIALYAAVAERFLDSGLPA